MKVPGIIIEDKKSGFFFGFIVDTPKVCAQGNTQQEVEAKMDKYWKSYTERVSHSKVEMTMIEA
jgi:predicted RNase H-like HicB family nuclease